MIEYKKFTTPLITLFLIILSFFIIDIDWWFSYVPIDEITLFFMLGTYIGMVTLGICLVAYIMKDSILKMKEHMVVEGIREKNYYNLWFLFPITMVLEEVIFRLYLFGFLFTFLDLIPSIFIGTIIFAVYHIHTWFEFKDKRITITFILFATILGLILNTLVYFLGLFACILMHWASAFLIFLVITNKIRREELNQKEEENNSDLNKTPNNYASNYVDFSGILAGLSFTLVFFYLGLEDLDFLDNFLILAFTFSSVCFLIGAVGYSDASKIKNNYIKLIQPGKIEKVVVVPNIFS
ncbi:MAG: CPBP family intramembrane glutamic endopeptidase [Promethearchaeia archaeon]